MSPTWRKIAGDFRSHRAQFLLIGLVLALGTMAVVTSLHTFAVLDREIPENFLRANSPTLSIIIDQPDAALLRGVRARPGVADADLRRVASTLVAGRLPGEWVNARLVVVPDLADQRAGVFHQHGDADWPAGDAGVLIEQSSLSLLAEGARDSLLFRKPGGDTVRIPISGVVHDTAVAPGNMERIVYVYATPAGAARAGLGADFDQIVVLPEDPNRPVGELAAALGAWLTSLKRPALRMDALPVVHPHATLMAALLQALQGVALLAFICSAAVAAYAVSLWMKREVRQVGIMKTIGASSWQLARQYLGLVACVVLAATIPAFLAGQQLAHGLTAYCARDENIDITSWRVPPSLLALEFAGIVGVPLLAVAFPILRAVWLTAREAIMDPGISAPAATGSLAARFIRWPGDRRWTFALRNTFRRKWRLAISVLALGLGGTVLLVAHSHYESLLRVLTDSAAERGHDLDVTLTRALPPAQLTALAASLPGVKITEAWRRTAGDIQPAGSGPAVRFLVSGYPDDTRLFNFPLKEGRFPAPAEPGAVVITRPLQRRLPALQIGAEVEVQFRNQRAKVRITGIIDEIIQPVMYLSATNFEALTGTHGVASDLRVKTAPGQTDAVVARLDQAIIDARLSSSLITTRANFLEVWTEHFLNFLVIFNTVALAAALAGGIGLMAFASLNVLERTREIGVIRTLGATPRQVTALFLAESGSIALLSVLLAVPASIPLGRAYTSLGLLFQVPVPYVTSNLGLTLLAGGVFVIMFGVWLVVRRLLRLSVRETLSYE